MIVCANESMISELKEETKVIKEEIEIEGNLFNTSAKEKNLKLKILLKEEKEIQTTIEELQTEIRTKKLQIKQNQR